MLQGNALQNLIRVFKIQTQHIILLNLYGE